MSKWQHEGSMHVFSKKGGGGAVVAGIIVAIIVLALIAG